MTDWPDIGALDDIPERGARVVKTHLGCIAVFRTVDSEVYAIDDACPHKGGPLSEGIVHGRFVTCPLHNMVLRLDTGLAKGAETGVVNTYPIRIADGRILLGDHETAPRVGCMMTLGEIRTTCAYCGVGCGVTATPDGKGGVTAPGTYEDLEPADLVVLVGSNLAWCHPVPYQRLVAAKAERPDMKIVVIDPRRTATCDLADLHLALEPGSDVALFNRLLAAIFAGGAIDKSYLTHVDGFDDALRAAMSQNGSVSGLTAAQIKAFCDLWVRTEKVVTVLSQSVYQSTSGTDKDNAIINCHLAAGRIGRPGIGPFSVTGQPHAVGGREVGGLANTLACHLDLEDSSHRDMVRMFWNAPAMPDAVGLKAVDLFNRVRDGQIKALWIVCTNPAVSMPDADAVRDAIAGCDFVVVSDVTARTDTAELAHDLLPATGWGEKDGTVTNSDRTINRQRALMPAAGQARADWDFVADVGRRMGWHAAFDYQSPSEIFAEYATLSGMAAAMGRDFDISGLADLTPEAYDALRPTRWPIMPRGRTDRLLPTVSFHPTGTCTAKRPA